MTTKKVITDQNLDATTLEVNTSNQLAVKVNSSLELSPSGIGLAQNLKDKLDKVDTLETKVSGKADTTALTALQQKVTTLESNPAGVGEDKFTVELTDLAGTVIGKVYVK